MPDVDVYFFMLFVWMPFDISDFTVCMDWVKLMFINEINRVDNCYLIKAFGAKCFVP